MCLPYTFSLSSKHRQSRKAVEETRATAESKREELKQLEDDLEKLRADRQLADFIRQRKDSTDYKKHLGVIAQAYADFEQLSILLTKVRQELEGVRTEQSGAGSSVPNDGKKKLLPRIDRIVLYIASFFTLSAHCATQPPWSSRRETANTPLVAAQIPGFVNTSEKRKRPIPSVEQELGGGSKWREFGEQRGR